MKVIDPCLGPEEYIEDPYQVGIKLFARYYLSHASQSTHYNNSVKSLNADIALSNGDADELRERIITSLTSIYTDTFSRFRLQVDIQDEEDKPQGVIIRLTYGNKESYNIHYGLQDVFSGGPSLVRFSESGEILN